MNFNHLFYFYVIAKEGSIVNACRTLHLTQSTLSNQLKDFENSLGVQLFERHHKKLVLNSTGQETYRYADNLFSSAQSFLTKIRSEASLPQTQVISIGIHSSLSTGLAHSFLSPLFTSKNIFVRLFEGDYSTLSKKIEGLEIDAILSDSPLPFHKKTFLHSQVLSTDIVFVADKKQEELSKNFPHCLQEKPFFHFSQGSQIRKSVDHYLKNLSISVRPIGETDDLAYILMGVLRNGLVAAIPQSAVNEQNQGHLSIIGKNTDISLDLWFTMRDCQNLHATLKKILNLH